MGIPDVEGLGVKSCKKVECLYNKNSLLDPLTTLNDNGESISVGFVKNLLFCWVVPVVYFLKTSSWTSLKILSSAFIINLDNCDTKVDSVFSV